MQDKNELQEFNLDDILTEFQDLPEDSSDLGELNSDLAQLVGDWDSDAAPAIPSVKIPDAVSMDTTRMNDLISQIAAATPDSAQAEETSASAPMDTIRMNELIAEITAEAADREASASEEKTIRMNPVSDDATIRMDTLATAELSSAPASEDATIRMESLPVKDAVTDDETIRLDSTPSGDTISMEPSVQEDAAFQDTPNIVYNPRTRLRELKKKLVAGPEKRFYELSEIGVGRMQTAIILNLIIVALSAVTTTMYSLNMIGENRLRFVIFSQILAMLLSAFLGCQQMLDGLGDLFKGRFTVNTMLSLTFAACCADAVLCLSELRIPCCAAFSLEITMAMWARYHRHTTESAQMDTMRKAVRLNGLVKEEDYFEGKAGILRRDGEVEDFMERYQRSSGPEIVQSIYCLLSMLVCVCIAVFAGMLHGTSLAVQILSVSLLIAIPAGFFVTLTRPAALLERRLHMVGTVLCGSIFNLS